MKNYFFKFVLIFSATILCACADEANMESTTDNQEFQRLYQVDKIYSLNRKYLFLEEFYNTNGEKEFKEPYHYRFGVDRGLLVRRIRNLNEYSLEIQVPSSDCNFQSLTCNEDNGVFSCGRMSTLIGCSYNNDLSQYYDFPEAFRIELESGVVVVKDTKSQSRAVFKIYNSKDELPPFNEPPQIEDPNFPKLFLERRN